MSTLARVYLAVTLSLLLAGVVFSWLSLRALDGDVTADVVIFLPQFDLAVPAIGIEWQVPVRLLASGWVALGLLVSALLIRLPFRVRQVAQRHRRLREYRKEVLELRTLPLRQAEDDALLAAEARLDLPRPKVMTEKLLREDMAGPSRTRNGIERGDA
ncbi:MAG: hypothetical protein V3V08_26275 [Nannocystaceae bacterium]